MTNAGDVVRGRDRRTIVRWSLGVLVVLGCLVGAFVLLRLVPLSLSPDDAATRMSAPSQPEPGTAPVDDLPEVRGIQLPDAGPGIDRPGVLLLVDIAADGTATVHERVRWGKGVDELRLAPPQVATGGDHFADARPHASDVEASADGVVLAVSGGSVERPVSVPLPAGVAETVDLSYQLEGSTVRTTPSKEGRALTAVEPLTRGLDDLPVSLFVAGKGASSISCPDRSASERVCGSGTPIDRAGPVPATESLFVLQVDLVRR